MHLIVCIKCDVNKNSDINFRLIAMLFLMFSENIHGWQEFYTTAGGAKYQLWPAPSQLICWPGGNRWDQVRCTQVTKSADVQVTLDETQAQKNIKRSMPEVYTFCWKFSLLSSIPLNARRILQHLKCQFTQYQYPGNLLVRLFVSSIDKLIRPDQAQSLLADHGFSFLPSDPRVIHETWNVWPNLDIAGIGLWAN